MISETAGNGDQVSFVMGLRYIRKMDSGFRRNDGGVGSSIRWNDGGVGSDFHWNDGEVDSGILRDDVPVS